jgi:membrane-associated phospholipid phosphatase
VSYQSCDGIVVSPCPSRKGRPPDERDPRLRHHESSDSPSQPIARTPDPLLTDHRRSLIYGAAAVLGLVLVMIGVGKHPTDAAPLTTLAAIGRTDASVYTWAVSIRDGFLTIVFKVFNFLGSGLFTVPLRIVLLAILLRRRRFGAATAFALTWLVSEVALTVLKVVFARGRPPFPLVATVTYSFPSGHATATAAITVSAVLAFMAPGHRRRIWSLAAVGFSLVMGFSRVYLGAHWLSDVVAGVLLGASSAVISFGVVDEVRDLTLPRIHDRRRAVTRMAS